jgi:hypothetical protein
VNSSSAINADRRADQGTTGPAEVLDVTLLRNSWRHWWSPTWYRGSVGPGWLPWVWTFGFNTGIALALTLVGVDVSRLFFESPRVLLQIVLFSILLSAFWDRFMANKSRLAHAEAERERERARALAVDKQLLDAQLRALSRASTCTCSGRCRRPRRRFATGRSLQSRDAHRLCRNAGLRCHGIARDPCRGASARLRNSAGVGPARSTRWAGHETRPEPGQTIGA